MSTRKRRSSSNSNLWTAVAIFVSFCALAVSVYQSIILRNEQYAAVWPYIEPSVQYSNQSFQFFIQNKGTGPAIIKDVRLLLDGEETATYQEFIEKLLRVQNFRSISISTAEKSVLSANERLQMLSAELPDSLAIPRIDFSSRASVQVCYCSIFGDCWQYIDGEVNRVNKCKE